MGSAVKRGEDTNRVSAKERPTSRKALKKSKRILYIGLVLGLVLGGVTCYLFKSEKAIEKVSTGMFIIVGAAAVVLKAFSKKEDSEKEDPEMEWLRAWKKHLSPFFAIAMISAGTVWVICFGKGAFLAEVNETEKDQVASEKETSKEESTEELPVTLTRNEKSFTWENDIYIEDLSVYYTGESEKITDEQQITYRCNLLEEYRNNRSESATQVNQEELNSRNYEELTQEANEYYQAFEFCNTSGFEDSVKLTNLKCSRKARINADSYKKNSENQRLIAVQIIDIGQIEMKSVEETYEPALEWEIKGYGQALVEIKDAEDEEARQAGQEQLQIIEDSIKTSYDNLADSGDDEVATKARRMQQVMEQK